MRGRLVDRVELIANFAIIVVALIAGAALVKRYLTAGPVHTNNGSSGTVRKPLPGTRVSLSDVDWKTTRRTLVLALSTGCHFCTESAPFYRNIADRAAGRSDFRLIGVFPPNTKTDGEKYLQELGVRVQEIKEAPLSAIGATGTPTLVLVDSNGSVVDSWLGRLPPEKESELLNRFTCDTCD